MNDTLRYLARLNFIILETETDDKNIRINMSDREQKGDFSRMPKDELEKAKWIPTRQFEMEDKLLELLIELGCDDLIPDLEFRKKFRTPIAPVENR